MSARPVYIVSGGIGSSGEHLVRTALAQFRDVHVPVEIIPNVHRIEQIEHAVKQAAQTHGLIVYTLVDSHLREQMIFQARAHNVIALDLMGQLLSQLTAMIGQMPLEQPGLYRQLRHAYFDRIEAIEFTVAHDDGRNAAELAQAEIVLIGVSRVGKTPLSMYLSVKGWKVANIPLVRESPPPPILFEIDARRVIGLTIDPGQLVAHRRLRQSRLGVPPESDYTDPKVMYEEVEAARELYRRSGFAVLNVTDKPIEESAEQVIALIRRWFSASKDDA
jgi:regulator of PEP synthase PpsR (kinase-PPPase family)